MNISRLSRLVCFLAISAQTANGSTAAIISFTNNSTAGHGNYDIAGFQFSTDSSIDITALGMWVSGASLADSHAIGVYDLSGDLQFSGSVNASATPDGSGFTWVDLTGSHILSAGSWFIGVQYNQGSADHMYDGTGGITMASGLTFLNAAVYYSNSPISLSDPAGTASLFTQGLPRDSYIGPNFTFTPAGDVPEPGTWAMLIVGASAFTLWRRVGGIST